MGVPIVQSREDLSLSVLEVKIEASAVVALPMVQYCLVVRSIPSTGRTKTRYIPMKIDALYSLRAFTELDKYNSGHVRYNVRAKSCLLTSNRIAPSMEESPVRDISCAHNDGSFGRPRVAD